MHCFDTKQLVVKVEILTVNELLVSFLVKLNQFHPEARLTCHSDEQVRLGYWFTPYQQLWLYNGTPLVAFYDTLGIRRTYSRLEPPASSRGFRPTEDTCIYIYVFIRVFTCGTCLKSVSMKKHFKKFVGKQS